MRGGRSLPAARRAYGWGFLSKALFALLSLVGVMLLANPEGLESLRDEQELAAFPSGEALPVLRMGHASLAADMAWIRAIQYYGKHRRDDRRYPYAEHLFRIITGLDAKFEQAYVFGGLVLSEDVRRPRAAEELLTRGMAQLPDSWWITFERGFLRWVRLGEPEAAAKDFYNASLCPDAPQWVARFAAYGYERAGEMEIAGGLWEQIAEETDNPMIREIAHRALERIGERESTGGGKP